TRLKVFPSDWNTRRVYEVAFKYPFLKSIVVSLAFIEANHHSGYTQRIALKWIRTGFGENWKPRPLLICRCGRATRKVYFRHGSLGCRRCSNAIHASQVCGNYTRPSLQAIKLRNFLTWKSYMSYRQRIQARLRSKAAQSTRLVSKRLKHDH